MVSPITSTIGEFARPPSSATDTTIAEDFAFIFISFFLCIKNYRFVFIILRALIPPPYIFLLTQQAKKWDLKVKHHSKQKNVIDCCFFKFLCLFFVVHELKQMAMAAVVEPVSEQGKAQLLLDCPIKWKHDFCKVES